MVLAASTFDHGLFDNSKNLAEITKQAFENAAPLLYILCVIMTVVGAFFFFTSAGDPARYKKGKEYIIAALSGAALTTVAYALLRLLGMGGI